jgi:[ribosomal protein S5]-alanine N-acetyltransferase
MLETLRLVLTPIARCDLDDIVRLYSDPEVVRFIGDGASAGREASEAWLERALAHWQDHGFGTWCVRLRSTHGFMGRVGLTVQEFEGGCEMEVGYMLAAMYWRQGYATEAATAVRNHAVHILGLHRLVALIDADNEASRRVAIKLGMAYERKVRFGSRWRELGMMTDLYALDAGVGHLGKTHVV